LPNREKNAFFEGFQKPLTPSYFSNIHLCVGVSVVVVESERERVGVTSARDRLVFERKSKQLQALLSPQQSVSLIAVGQAEESRG